MADAELRARDPSIIERIAEKIAGYMPGNEREAYQRARKIAETIDTASAGNISGGADLADAVRDFVKTAKDQWFSPKVEEKPLGRDEFFSARRSRRETLEEAQRRAETEARQSPEYKDLMAKNWRKGAEDLVAKRKASAEGTWKAAQGTIPDEDKRIEADWQAYQADRERQKAAELDKGFAERNPVLAKAIPVAGGVGSALLARYGLGKVYGRGAEYAKALKEAVKAGDPAAVAEAGAAAEKFAGRLPYYQTGTLLGASTVPADMRLTGDLVDKYGLPEGAGAQKRASDRLSLKNLPETTADLAKGMISGGIGAMVGSKFVKTPSPSVDLHGATAILRPDYEDKVKEIAKRLQMASREKAATAEISSEAETAAQRARALAADSRQAAAEVERRSGGPSAAPASAPEARTGGPSLSPAPSQNPASTLPAPVQSATQSLTQGAPGVITLSPDLEGTIKSIAERLAGANPGRPPIAGVRTPGSGRWAEEIAPTARDVLKDRAAAGQPLGPKKAAEIGRAIEAKLPEGIAPPSAADVRTRVANQIDAVGNTPSPEALDAMFAKSPGSLFKGRKVFGAVPAIGAAGGVLSPGDADAAPGVTTSDIARMLMR